MGAIVEADDQGGVVLRTEYHCPPEVKAFVEDAARVTAFFGPLGCGKTVAGVQKVWSYAQVNPGALIVVVRDTYPNLIHTTQRSFFEWWPDGAAGSYAVTDRVFTMHTPGKPAEILFKSMEGARDMKNVLSLEPAAIWIDEPQGGIGVNEQGQLILSEGLDVNLFKGILGRAGRQQGGYPGMVWLTGNPPSPSHWIAQEFRYPGCGDPTNPRRGWHLHLGTQATNRHNLPPDYYENLAEDYGVGSPMYRRYLMGEWIDFAAEKPFLREWIAYHGTELWPRPMKLTIEAGVDPAISKHDGAAYTAIVVAGQCRESLYRGQIYVLHAEKGHWSVYETVDRLLTLVKELKITTVRIEDVAYQKGLGEVLEHEKRLRRINVGVDMVKPDGDKVRRAHAWAGLVQKQVVLFHPSQDSSLIAAMLAVPQDARQWDLVDAAGLCIRGFPLMQPEQSKLLSRKETKQLTRAASYATQVPTGTGRKAEPWVRRQALREYGITDKKPGAALARSYAVRRPPRPPRPARSFVAP